MEFMLVVGILSGLRVSGTVAKVLLSKKSHFTFSSLGLVASAYIDVEGKYLSKIKARRAITM